MPELANRITARLSANGFPLILLGGGAIISLIPVLSLSLSAFPSADDYCLAVESLKGPLQMQILMYREWTGRFTSSLLQALLSRWDLAGIYPWFCAATLAATASALYAFVAVVVRCELSRTQIAVVTLVAMAVLLDGMPSVTEAFFWMASATTYQWVLVAYLVWLTLLLRIVTADSVNELTPVRVGVVGLTILLPGFNEVMMPVVLATVGTFALATYRSTHPSRRFMCVLCAVAVAATAASLIAPGNVIRSHTYPDIPTRHNVYFALAETGLRTWRFVVRYGLSGELWTFAVATWWWAPRVTMRAMIAARRFPLGGTWGFSLLLMTVLYLTLFPVYWEYGTDNYTGEGRTYNVTYMAFCVCVVWFAWTTLSAASARWPEMSARMRMHHGRVDWAVAASLAMLIVGSPSTTQALRAATLAPHYLHEQKIRERILRASGNQQQTVVVNAIRVKPSGLFWGDIQPDARHWINSCVAKYYGVGSVRTPRPPSVGDNGEPGT